MNAPAKKSRRRRILFATLAGRLLTNGLPNNKLLRHVINFLMNEDVKNFHLRCTMAAKALIFGKADHPIDDTLDRWRKLSATRMVGPANFRTRQIGSRFIVRSFFVTITRRFVLVRFFDFKIFGRFDHRGDSIEQSTLPKFLQRNTLAPAAKKSSQQGCDAIFEQSNLFVGIGQLTLQRCEELATRIRTQYFVTPCVQV
jgi:hypothetical protein